MESNMAHDYVYESLVTAQSIRLIELHPRDVGSATSISFSLRSVNLDKAPPFDALSYTWGCPFPAVLADSSDDYDSPCHEARCNGQRFLVRRSLLQALEAIRDLSFLAMGLTKQRYVWADAICIDQSNMQERASQVKLMGNLYSRADSVISWLGPDDGTVADAVFIAKHLATFGILPRTKEDYAIAKQAISHIGLGDFFDRDAYRQKLGIDRPPARQWIAFAALLSRPYFRRTWIVQEVTLAKSIVALCGDHIFDFDHILAAISFIGNADWFDALGMPGLRFMADREPERVQPFEKLLETKPHALTPLYPLLRIRTCTTPAGRFALDTLLDYLRSHEASDARDKVFGLLGIVRADLAPFNDPHKTELLRPDYTVSTEQLFIRTTRLLVESRSDLRLLLTKESPRMTNIKTLPSWVPDYTASRLPGAVGTGLYLASGTMQWTLDGRTGDDALLGVQGYCLGSIQQHSMCPFKPDGGYANTPSEESLIWGTICDVAAGMPDWSNSQSRIEVLARTLMADNFGTEEHAPVEAFAHQFMCHAATMIITSQVAHGMEEQATTTPISGSEDRRITPWVRLFESELQPSVFSLDGLESASAAIATEIEEAMPDGENPMAFWRRNSKLCTKIRDAMLTIMDHRILFRADTGLLGAGPINTQVGDEVWILAGAKTPVVLRPSESGHHQLLGESYVHGVMHGQALDYGLPLRDVILE